MKRFAALLVVLALASSARAGEAEDAYARLVRQVAPGAKRARAPSGAIVSTVELRDRAQAQEWLSLLKAFEEAFRMAPEGERPKALELARHLADLHETLAWAAALAQPTGGVVRARVKLTDDAGGWDSVTFGRNGYPSITGELSVVLPVPARFLPGKTSVPPERQPLVWACPQAVFQTFDPRRVQEEPAAVERSLADLERFVKEVLPLAGRTALPQQLFVLEPPEVGHDLARLASDPDPLPLSFRVVPVREWGGVELSPATPLAELSEARRNYERLLHGDHQREVLANCALVAQRLAIDPVRPLVTTFRAEQKQQLLAPYLRQYALYPVVVRTGPAEDAEPAGEVRRGAQMEVLEGLELTADEPPRVVPQPWLRVRVANGPEGWVAGRRTMRWQTDGLEASEAQDQLSPEPPPAGRAMEQVLARHASAWRLARQTAADFKTLRAKEREQVAESASVAAGERASFCKLKAQALAAFGAEWFARATKEAQKQRVAEGENAGAAAALLRQTYEDPRCGAVSR